MTKIDDLEKQIKTALEMAQGADLSSVRYLLEMAMNEVRHQAERKERPAG